MNIQPVSHQAAAQQLAPVQQSKTVNIKADAMPVAQKPAAVKAQPKDTVQISSLAKQALQEATKMKSQISQEAQGGDIQEKKSIDKEAAIKAAQQQQQSANPASNGAEKSILLK